MVFSPEVESNEADVARRLGISRTPVREAFARLAKDSVLAQVPRRGVFVAEQSRENVEEVASFRTVVEGFAARQACLKLQPEDVARLVSIVDFVARHQTLLAAIASGDLERAEQAAIDHIRKASAHIIANRDGRVHTLMRGGDDATA